MHLKKRDENRENSYEDKEGDNSIDSIFNEELEN